MIYLDLGYNTIAQSQYFGAESHIPTHCNVTKYIV